jgi:ubiquitin-activating enzyme E1 C
MGAQGIYTHSVAYERDPGCPVCSAGVPLEVDKEQTLQQVIDKILESELLGKDIKSPSVSLGAENLYAHGIYEAETRPNLTKKIGELVPGGGLLTINAKSLAAPRRVMLRFSAS